MGTAELQLWQKQRDRVDEVENSYSGSRQSPSPQEMAGSSEVENMGCREATLGLSILPGQKSRASRKTAASKNAD